MCSQNDQIEICKAYGIDPPQTHIIHQPKAISVILPRYANKIHKKVNKSWTFSSSVVPVDPKNMIQIIDTIHILNTTGIGDTNLERLYIVDEHIPYLSNPSTADNTHKQIKVNKS